MSSELSAQVAQLQELLEAKTKEVNAYKEALDQREKMLQTIEAKKGVGKDEKLSTDLKELKAKNEKLEEKCN